MQGDSQQAHAAAIKRQPIVRLCKLILAAAVVLGSLTVFPSGVPFLVMAWVLAACVLLANRHQSWAGICWAALGVILIVKSPSNSYSFFLLVAVSLLAGAVCCLSKSNWNCRAVATLSLLVTTWFGVDRRAQSMASESLVLVAGRPIVCIGDSLTEGVNGGFPAELQKLVSPPVVNLGRNGYTAQMGIDDLLPKLKALEPQLVVVELGGHDYNTGESRADTKQKLRQIIEDIKAGGAAVLLVEIPRGIVQDPFWGLERELAGEFDLELVSDTIVRRCFFFSPIVPPGIWMDKRHHLSDDGLHPNARGQVEFAEAVAAAIERMQD